MACINNGLYRIYYAFLFYRFKQRYLFKKKGISLKKFHFVQDDWWYTAKSSVPLYLFFQSMLAVCFALLSVFT